jgi:hypothetical protein
MRWPGTLGYPTTKPAVAPTMVLVGATETQAIFARASKLSQAWESCLRAGHVCCPETDR